ncbi:MAG: hypothetical protein ACR2KM_06635 [Gemmatimonadaceae bacterium]
MKRISVQSLSDSTQQQCIAAGEDIRRMICTAPADRDWGSLRQRCECARHVKTTWPQTLTTLSVYNGSTRKVALRLLSLDAHISAAPTRDEAALFRAETELQSAIDVIQCRCATGVATRAERAELAHLLLEYEALCLPYAECEAEIIHAPLRLAA